MGFLSKIFGFGSNKTVSDEKALEVLENTLKEVIAKSGFDLEFSVHENDGELVVELTGADEELLKEKDGMLLDALQFFCRRVVQHNLPESKANLSFDVGGFREQAGEALVELADKLKNIAIERNKAVYFRALPPKDRKIIHQHLSQDDRVKSSSIGEGLYKKIRVVPVGFKQNNKKRGPRKDNRGPRPERNNNEAGPSRPSPIASANTAESSQD